MSKKTDNRKYDENFYESLCINRAKSEGINSLSTDELNTCKDFFKGAINVLERVCPNGMDSLNDAGCRTYVDKVKTEIYQLGKNIIKDDNIPKNTKLGIFGPGGSLTPIPPQPVIPQPPPQPQPPAQPPSLFPDDYMSTETQMSSNFSIYGPPSSGFVPPPTKLNEEKFTIGFQVNGCKFF